LPRRSLAEAAERYLPDWAGGLTPHVRQHVHGIHAEDAWAAGQQRAADRWKGRAR
jgi:hypothetical protein